MSQAITESTLLNDLESADKRITILERSISNLNSIEGSFQAHPSTAFNLGITGPAFFPMNVIDWNYGGWYRANPNFGGRLGWFIPIPCIVHIDWQMTNDATIPAVQPIIRKNGFDVAYSVQRNDNWSNGSKTFVCNANDFFEPIVTWSAGSTYTVSAPVTNSFWSGFVVARF